MDQQNAGSDENPGKDKDTDNAEEGVQELNYMTTERKGLLDNIGHMKGENGPLNEKQINSRK